MLRTLRYPILHDFPHLLPHPHPITSTSITNQSPIYLHTTSISPRWLGTQYSPLSVPRTRLPFLQILESSQTKHKPSILLLSTHTTPHPSNLLYGSQPPSGWTYHHRISSPLSSSSITELRATSYHRAAVSETAASPSRQTDTTRHKGTVPGHPPSVERTCAHPPPRTSISPCPPKHRCAHNRLASPQSQQVSTNTVVTERERRHSPDGCPEDTVRHVGGDGSFGVSGAARPADSNRGSAGAGVRYGVLCGD